MNAYEAKQEARRERLERRADKLRGVAAREFDKADLREEKSGIPFGQPILVGHHSEKRHRNAIKRADAAMGRAVAATEAAGKAAARAAAVGTGGISSDDPDAIDKLREKLATLEARQNRMRHINKVHAAFKKNPEAPRTKTLMGELTAEERRIVETYEPPYSWEKHPFAPYQLSNNNANIKRVRDRIATLERAAEREHKEVTHGNIKLVQNVEENRVQLIFPGKPDRETRTKLKRAGFRWAPSAGAWQRHLNNAGIWAAEQVVKELNA